MHISSSSKVTTEEHLIPAADPLAEPRCVQPREQDVEYDVTHAPSPADGDRFLILTNADGAVNFKLMSAPVDEPGRAHWTEVVPHRPEVKLEGVSAFTDHLVRYERREGVRRIVVTSYADGAEHELRHAGARLRHRPGHQRRVRHHHAALHLHVPRHPVDRLRRRPRHRRAHAAEADGGPRRPRPGGLRDRTALGDRAPTATRVPISFVHRAGIAHDGSAPCLLYGYGSYEACIDPTFSTLRLSLLDRGFVFAIAHVRGGGELGRPWYDDGKLLHKRNTFTDFIACAEHLVAEGVTTPERLVARGGIAGGLLMGAVTNLRPDLFAAVVAEVPFVDCLTTILDETLPAHRHRVGGVGQPGRRPRGVRVHEGVQPVRQRRPGATTPPSSPPPASTIPACRTGSRPSGCRSSAPPPPAAARST